MIFDIQAPDLLHVYFLQRISIIILKNLLSLSIHSCPKQLEIENMTL
jgi:hypothetical protein